MPDAVAPVPEVHNRDDVMQACLPGAGGIMSARAVARFFAMLANGGCLGRVRLLSEDRLRACTTPRANVEELDVVLYGGNRYAAPIGTGGYWYGHGLLGTGPSVLCHSGAGGAIGWADLDERVAIAICHNRMFEWRMPAANEEDHPFLMLRNAIRELV